MRFGLPGMSPSASDFGERCTNRIVRFRNIRDPEHVTSHPHRACTGLLFLLPLPSLLLKSNSVLYLPLWRGVWTEEVQLSGLTRSRPFVQIDRFDKSLFQNLTPA